jgi:germination protein M
MTQRFFVIIAVLVLAVCLISGGCQPANESKDIKSWRDLVNLLPEPEKETREELPVVPTVEPMAQAELNQETIEVMLYFGGQDGLALVEESRIIPKEEGIARSTVNELLKGPDTPEYLSVVPEGTRLLDINVKPDGLCIINLSSEACQVANQQQEEMMIMAIANTVGQFPTVKEVAFMIEGERVQEIGGFMDLSQPVIPVR